MSEDCMETLTDRTHSYTASRDWVGRSTAVASSSSVLHWPPGPWPAERHEATFAVSRATMTSAWFNQVVRRLAALLALAPNWNGYGERTIHPASAKRLVALLDVIAYSGDTPAVVPLSDGSLQLEWHRGDLSLEVEVPPNGPAVGWLSGADQDEEWVITTPEGLQLFRDRVQALLGS